MALAYHNMRDVDVAVDAFKNLLELDPFRLENMDSYSNLLYVKAVRSVAHDCGVVAQVSVKKKRNQRSCKGMFSKTPSGQSCVFSLIGWWMSTNIA